MRGRIVGLFSFCVHLSPFCVQSHLDYLVAVFDMIFVPLLDELRIHQPPVPEGQDAEAGPDVGRVIFCVVDELRGVRL